MQKFVRILWSFFFLNSFGCSLEPLQPPIQKKGTTVHRILRSARAQTRRVRSSTLEQKMRLRRALVLVQHYLRIHLKFDNTIQDNNKSLQYHKFIARQESKAISEQYCSTIYYQDNLTTCTYYVYNTADTCSYTTATQTTKKAAKAAKPSGLNFKLTRSP